MQRCAGALRYLTCRTQRGRTKLIETWQSGIDDKWGVSPVWRAPALVPTEPGDATARRGQLTFMRECETLAASSAGRSGCGRCTTSRGRASMEASSCAGAPRSNKYDCYLKY